jgi:hypothetical protein
MKHRILSCPGGSRAGRILPAGPRLLAAVLLISAPGCDDDGATDCERQLEVQRTEHRREIARLKSELHRRELEARGFEADCRGAVLIWGSTAAALFVAVLLLVRERRGRRVVDRLLRIILGRVGRTRGPSGES